MPGGWLVKMYSSAVLAGISTCSETSVFSFLTNRRAEGDAVRAHLASTKSSKSSSQTRVSPSCGFLHAPKMYANVVFAES